MKITNYLLFLAIYGTLTGSFMLFDGAGSLKNYGVNPDQYHIAAIEYLGIANIAAALLIFFIRNEVSQKVIKTILLISAAQMILSSFKGFYDVKILEVPGNTFFWVDAAVRFVVGMVSLGLAFNVSKKD